MIPVSDYFISVSGFLNCFIFLASFSVADTQKISKIVIIKAIIGAANANTDIKLPPTVSVLATMKLPVPPVVAVDVALRPANPELITLAVPPRQLRPMPIAEMHRDG